MSDNKEVVMVSKGQLKKKFDRLWVVDVNYLYVHLALKWDYVISRKSCVKRSIFIKNNLEWLNLSL